MKILLISPSQEKVYGKKMLPADPPLGLLYIGAVLKNEGHQVRLVDIDIEDIDEKEFSAIFRDFNPDATGITSTTPTFSDALKWAGISKKLKEDAFTVLGGPHVTVAPGEAIKQNAVDVVVVGEGELTAKEVFNELSESQPNLENIKGIYFKQNNKITMNDKRPFIENLDTIPFPDRTLLKKPYAYMPPDATSLPVATIMTSRGCPGNCTFCCTKSIFSKRFRARSVANIVEEVECLVNKEHIKDIHIIDDVFTMNRQRVFELREEIKRRRIDVDFQLINGLRADFADEDILRALKDIGVKTVGYGVESGSEKILKNVRKGIPLDITRNVFKLSKELGFETWAFFIFGLPGETEKTIKESIRFAKELDPDFVKFLILKPYPGSEVYDELQKENLILSSNYDDYGVYTKPVHKLPGLEPEKMLHWQRRAFRGFYLRPGKIISHLRRIKSWTQFRLLINDCIFALSIIFRKRK